MLQFKHRGCYADPECFIQFISSLLTPVAGGSAPRQLPAVTEDNVTEIIGSHGLPVSFPRAYAVPACHASAQQFCCDCLPDLQAVDGCRDDAACISCALPSRVQPGCGDALEVRAPHCVQSSAVRRHDRPGMLQTAHCSVTSLLGCGSSLITRAAAPVSHAELLAAWQSRHGLTDLQGGGGARLHAVQQRLVGDEAGQLAVEPLQSLLGKLGCRIPRRSSAASQAGPQTCGAESRAGAIGDRRCRDEGRRTAGQCS